MVENEISYHDNKPAHYEILLRKTITGFNVGPGLDERAYNNSNKHVPTANLLSRFAASKLNT